MILDTVDQRDFEKAIDHIREIVLAYGSIGEYRAATRTWGVPELITKGGNSNTANLIMRGLLLRFVTAIFRKAGDAVPMHFDLTTRDAVAAFNNLPGKMFNAKESQGGLVKADVVRIVMSSFPVPDEIIPWEEILLFRRETETQRKWLALKVWINEVARAALPPAEIEDKFQQLLAEYKRYRDRRNFAFHLVA